MSADDQIAAFIDRILRLKSEADDIAADIKEIYAEAHGNGFNKTRLGEIVTYLRKVEKDKDGVAEAEAVRDLYLTAYFRAKGKPHAYARARGGENEPEHEDEITEPQPPQPAEQQHDDHVAGDRDEAPRIPVANIQPETANEARDEIGHVAVDAADHSLDGTGNAATHRNPGGENVDAPDVPAIPTTEHASGKTAGASAPAAPAPKYAAPGEITYETHPPEGVERSSVSIAFGNMGQDPVLIAHDLEKGTAQPIVKQGKVILDGWARFMQARDMRELDGQPMAYAVVQYDGEDPLIDAIRMNVGGRTLDDHQKKLIAAKLAQQNPKRKDDIYRAFEIFLEPV